QITRLDLAGSIQKVGWTGIASSNVGNLGVLLLAGSLRLTRLESLDLTLNLVSDGGVKALAAAALPALRELRLGHNDISNDGASALAESTTFASLELLDLRRTNLTPHGATHLRDRFGSRVRLLLDDGL